MANFSIVYDKSGEDDLVNFQESLEEHGHLGTVPLIVLKYHAESSECHYPVPIVTDFTEHLVILCFTLCSGKEWITLYFTAGKSNQNYTFVM